MRYYELLVSIFEKEIGNIIEERRIENDFGRVYDAKFLYQDKIVVRIMFVEIEENMWVIHHELSKEDLTLLKKILYLCQRIERIGNTKSSSIQLSGDLQDVQQQHMLITMIKCRLQNFINLFTLFKTPGLKPHNIEKKILTTST